MVAAAYRATSGAVAARAGDTRREPIWLPSGWLAVALTLAAALQGWFAPSAFGAETPGWRPRAAATTQFNQRRVLRKPTPAPRATVRPVSFEDDIAGPALVAGELNPNEQERSVVRGYRVAQEQEAGDLFGDALKDTLTRPFGETTEPEAMPEPTDSQPVDNAPADGQPFGDLPAEPTQEEAPADPPHDDYRAPAFGGPTEPRSTAEEVAPAPPADTNTTDDLAEPLGAGKQSKLQKERTQAQQDCAEGLAALKAKRLDSINLSIGIPGVEGEDFPIACSIDDGTAIAPRCWSDVTYMWKAAALCHKPLYFEDVHLERYGHSWGPIMDPVVSGVHFFGRFPVLPYCMGLTPPNECIYTLGHYRPGSCAPYMIDPIPFSWRAALFQTGATFGAAAILP